MESIEVKGEPNVIKSEQKGFTIVELLVSIGIIGVIAPLLAVGLFQILTFTERGRAGFAAQADTRTAAGWMSQDLVMAAEHNLGTEDEPNTALRFFCGVNPDTEELPLFEWTDMFDDRMADHSVSYCLDGTELKRTDEQGSTIVIARNIQQFTMSASSPEKGVITVQITSSPTKNRFGVTDSKTFEVVMRPTF